MTTEPEDAFPTDDELKGLEAAIVGGDGIMKKFKVTFSEICTREIDIIADTKEEAEQKVRSGNFDIDESCETYSELARIDYSEEIIV